jgi:hypothetical protein
MSENDLAVFGDIELGGAVEQGNDDGYITRFGKIFELGDYPDKGLSMSAEDLKHAVEVFQPVPIDYQHVPGPLDGKLGQWVEAKLSDDGRSVLGFVKIPTWLDKLLEDTGRKVSAAIDTTVKEFRALALVNNPRISDAALMAAFAEAEAEDGQQQANSTNDDHSNNSGAKSEMDQTTNNTNTATATQVVDIAKFEAEQAALKSQNEVLARQVAVLQADLRHKEAVSFAEAEITAMRAFPAEKVALVALFEQSMLDDQQDGGKAGALATFGDGNTQASRVDALKKFCASRVSYASLTKEQLASQIEAKQAEGIALFQLTNKQETETGDNGKLTEAKRTELLGMTSIGRDVLKAKQSATGKQ